jgi:hypothetical protein
MSKKPAGKEDWRTSALPEASVLLPIEGEFTRREFQRIKLGLVPTQMEDKWFIYFERGWLNFHRSWTGVCIYRVRFKHKKDEYAIAEAWANRDPDEYSNTDDEYDIGLLSYLIYAVLLNEPMALPVKSADADSSALEQWGMVGREMLKKRRKQGNS